MSPMAGRRGGVEGAYSAVGECKVYEFTRKAVRRRRCVHVIGAGGRAARRGRRGGPRPPPSHICGRQSTAHAPAANSTHHSH